MLATMIRLLRIPALGLAVAALAAGPAAAVAAAPEKGASYKGTLTAPRTSIKVSLAVSADGRKITKLRISNIPLFCSGGGPPVPITFKAAKTSIAGTFTSTGVQHITSGPHKGQLGARLSITGKFGAGGSEHGAVTVKFPTAKSCDGTTTYSTRA